MVEREGLRGLRSTREVTLRKRSPLPIGRTPGLGDLESAKRTPPERMAL